MILNFKKLKDLRLASGHTQQSFAGAVGISLGTYRDMEQGKTALPTADKLEAIAQELGVKLSTITTKTAPSSSSRKAKRGRPKRPPVKIKFLGYASAGQPIDNNETAEDGGASIEDLIGDPRRVFYVRVSGNSMSAYGIHHGDRAIFEPETDVRRVRDGTVVLAQIGGGYVLKELVRVNGRPVLRSRSDDPRHKDIVPDDEDGGKLVGVYATKGKK